MFAAGAGLQLLFLKYGRDAERQADELGFKYALEENYDVREMADVFAALQQAGQASGQSPLPSWLATHPDPGERIERTQARLAALEQPLTNLVSDRPEYLQHIDGLVYGQNPRNGFFEGSVFYHPELRFRIDFPDGWQTQNLAQAVMAGSPQQDAVIQLTLSQQADPVTAARAFLSQQGVRAGATFQEPVNGIPAAGSYFEAQTQQGVVQGLVAFFSYGGATYQVISYAPAGRFEQYDAAFRRALGSFAPMTDPRILSVQPPRVDIVRAEQPTTLTALSARYRTAVPVEELALINQLPGADAQIAAGDLVKLVAPTGAAGG
jgi:predicted Zn-dependent protease